jgi:hypothetical protein
MQDEVRSQTKQRLRDLLKAAVGGVVVATATLATPAVASTPAGSLAERVSELQKQSILTSAQGAIAQGAFGFHNWGNHWHNWGNWHNWHNWHNW